MPIFTTIAIAAGSMLLSELGDYATDSVSEAVFGKEKDKLAELNKGQEEIKKRLDVCISKIESTNIRIQLQEATNKINNAYEQLIEFSNDKDYADKWSKEVLSPMHGIEASLRNIERSMKGVEQSESIILTYITILNLEKDSKQSKHYKAMQFYSNLILIQQKGFLVYTNAYKYVKGKETDISEIKNRLELALKDQALVNKKRIDELNQWYQDATWNDSPFMNIIDNENYVEIYENSAPEGHVVTGLQLYKKGNRIALRIRHSLPSGFNEPNATPAVWKDSISNGDQPGRDYFNINENNYVHLEHVTVPDGKVLIGAQLFKYGNRIALKLHVAALNEKRTQVEAGTKEWIQPKKFEQNYYEIDGDNVFAHGAQVMPTPLSYLTSVAFHLYRNRLAIMINTSMDTV